MSYGKVPGLADGKRLLVLTRSRDNASFRQRIEACFPALSERGVAVEVIELAASPLSRRRQFRLARQFDGLWLHRKTLTAWDAFSLGSAARRLIYDFDDAVMYQARSADAGPNRSRLRRFRRTVERADLVLAGNAYLAEHITRPRGRVAIVPTGLDASRYPPKAEYRAAGPVRLVWIGSRSTIKLLHPFRDALAGLAAIRPEVSLRIIADAGLDVPGLTVENLPWSLASESRLLAECDIGIAPMPDTPFTRGKCAFKVLQYMAAGLPVVTSPFGANAEYVREGQTGLMARDAAGWLDAVTRLAGDASLRQRLGSAGRRDVEARFDVHVLAPRVAGLIADALAR
jgi:glycosyltransferase involved in cell wall biosynthesis